MGRDDCAFTSWLREIGNVRRKIILRKLKNELKDKGMTSREVYRGLLQLATNARILLPRLHIGEFSHHRSHIASFADTVKRENSLPLHDVQPNVVDINRQEMTEVGPIRSNEAPDDSASSRETFKPTRPELLDENVRNESPFLVKIPRSAITLNLHSYGPISSKKYHQQGRPSPEIRIADSSVSDIENTRDLGEKCNYRGSINDERIAKRPKIVEDVTCLEGTIIPLSSLSKLPKIPENPTKITKSHQEHRDKRKRNEQNDKLSDERTLRTTKKSRLRRKFRQLFGNELTLSEVEEEDSMIDRFVHKKRRKCNSRISKDSGVGLRESACSEEISIRKQSNCPIESKTREISFENYASGQNFSLNEEKDDDCDQNLRSMPSLDAPFESVCHENFSTNLPDSTNTDEKSSKPEVTTADSSNDEKICSNGKFTIFISPVDDESPDAFAPLSLEIDLACESQISTTTSTTGYLPVSKPEKMMSNDDTSNILDIDVQKNPCDITLQGQTLNVQEDEEMNIFMTDSSPSTPEPGENLIIDESMEIYDESTNLKNSKEEIRNFNKDKSSFPVIHDREREQEAPMDLCSRPRETEKAGKSTRTGTKRYNKFGITSSAKSTGSIANAVEITANIENGVENTRSIDNGVENTENIANGLEMMRNTVNGIVITRNIENVVERTKNIVNGVENTQIIANGVEITQNITNDKYCLPPPPAPKFRVLHHHELGSRWCPTPLNNGPVLVDTQNIQSPIPSYSPISPSPISSSPISPSPISPITPILPIQKPQGRSVPIQQPSSLDHSHQMSNAFLPNSTNLRNLPQQTFLNPPNSASNWPGISSTANDMNKEPERSMLNIIFNHLIPLHSYIERNKFPCNNYDLSQLRNQFAKKKNLLWLELGKFCSLMRTNDMDRIICTITRFYEFLFPPGKRILSITKVTEILLMQQLPLLQINVDQGTNALYAPILASSQYQPPPPYSGTFYVRQNSNGSYVTRNIMSQHPLRANLEQPRAERFRMSGILNNDQLRTFYNQVAIYNELSKSIDQALKENSVKEKRKRRSRKKAAPLEDNTKKTAGNNQENNCSDHMEETILRVLLEAQQSSQTVNREGTSSRVQLETRKSPESINQQEAIFRIQPQMQTSTETINQQETISMVQQETQKSLDTINREQTTLRMQPEARISRETINQQGTISEMQPEARTGHETINQQETISMVQPETQNSLDTINRGQITLRMQPEIRESRETINQQGTIFGMQPEACTSSEMISQQGTILMVQPEACTRPETIKQQETILSVQQQTQKSRDTVNGEQIILWMQPETRKSPTINRLEINRTTEHCNETRDSPAISLNDSTVGIADVLQELDALSTKNENDGSKQIILPSTSQCDESLMIPGGSSGCSKTRKIITEDMHEESCVDETEEIWKSERSVICPEADERVVEKNNDEDEAICNNDENSNKNDQQVDDESSENRRFDVITLDDCDSNDSVKTQDAASSEGEQIFSILEVKSISKDVFNSMNGHDNVENEVCESIVEEKREEEIVAPLSRWSGCFRCGKPSSVVCDRCYLAFYCSAECHEAHWTEYHYLYCKPVPVETLAKLKSCDRSS